MLGVLWSNVCFLRLEAGCLIVLVGSRRAGGQESALHSQGRCSRVSCVWIRLCWDLISPYSGFLQRRQGVRDNGHYHQRESADCSCFQRSRIHGKKAAWQAASFLDGTQVARLKGKTALLHLPCRHASGPSDSASMWDWRSNHKLVIGCRMLEECPLVDPDCRELVLRLCLLPSWTDLLP